MTAKNYWIQTSIAEVGEDGEPLPGNGSSVGGVISLRTDDGWYSDEELLRIVKHETRFMANMLRQARQREMDEAREEARPFWSRWLGA